MSVSTSTRPVSSRTGMRGNSGCDCCRSSTNCITRCPTKARGRWKWNWQSACGKPGTASGKRRKAGKTRRRRRTCGRRCDQTKCKEQDMRILVIGAGATGGYFGGRLLEAGRDVTFLVREKRADLLAKNGLNINSPGGDYTRPNPPTLLAKNIKQPFDVIILSCKAYDLDDAMASFASAVGPDTAIIP